MNLSEAPLRIKNQVLSKTIQNDQILLDLDKGNYFGLDETGAWVWDQLKTGTTLDVLVNKLVTVYDVKESVAKNDVGVFIEELRAHDLLESL